MWFIYQQSSTCCLEAKPDPGVRELYKWGSGEKRWGQRVLEKINLLLVLVTRYEKLWESTWRTHPDMNKDMVPRRMETVDRERKLYD